MKLSSLQKSLRVIDILAREPQGLALGQVADRLGAPKPTVHHILKTFVAHDYVFQDPETRRYQIGYKFLTISRTILDNLDIRKHAEPHMRRLHQACGLAVHLAVLRNNKFVYIEKIGAPEGLSLVSYVGYATDPHAASGGKVLLAALDPDEVTRLYADKPLRPYGKKTITSLPELQAELAKVRVQGYAVDDEEYYEGVRCVAAPVRAGERVVAALSVTGSVFNLSLKRIRDELVGQVKDAAAGISAEMRW